MSRNGGEEVLVLRLYIAGRAPNSMRALDNLNALCESLQRPCSVDVVDVLEEPLRALEDGILVTPTLVRVAPPPTWKIVGDLSDGAKVRVALGGPSGSSQPRVGG